MVDPVETLDPAEDRRVVLIVEDEFLLRWPASEFLRDSGYRVIEVASVSDAMLLFAGNTHVDIVFSDVNLGGELTGHALASWLEKHRPGIPVLLTSGVAQAPDPLSAGPGRSFIAKPYALADIDRRIKDMLARNAG